MHITKGNKFSLAAYQSFLRGGSSAEIEKGGHSTTTFLSKLSLIPRVEGLNIKITSVKRVQQVDMVGGVNPYNCCSTNNGSLRFLRLNFVLGNLDLVFANPSKRVYAPKIGLIYHQPEVQAEYL